MIALRTVTVHHAEVQVYHGGAGPDVVFLHDAGGLTEKHPFLAKLAERFRVHAPLLPGYGTSQESASIRDMLDVTLHTFDVIDALGLKRPILAGHSLGGMIAAEMAAVSPHDVERLCLIAPAGLWDDATPIPDIFSMLPSQFPEALFHDPAWGAAVMTAGVKMDDPAFLVPFLVNNARQLGMAGKFLFPIPDRGLRERLYRIRARTMIVWGESDRMIAPSYAEQFRGGIRGSEIVRVPKAGHMVTLEQPGAVVSALERLAAN